MKKEKIIATFLFVFGLIVSIGGLIVNHKVEHTLVRFIQQEGKGLAILTAYSNLFQALCLCVFAFSVAWLSLLRQGMKRQQP